MPAFRPVPAHQACRFSLSFGENDRSTKLLLKDVPDRLLNRITINAAVVAVGKRSIAELDALAHAAQSAFAPNSARNEPDNFWKRTANGMPRLRLDGKHGVSQVKLARKMQFLGSGQDAIERVRRWPLWALIHPDPVDTDGLLWLEELIAELATTKEWFEITDRSVSPSDQGARIIELVKDDKVDLALNAHWLSLRRSSIEADLPRYACLYHAWLRLRPLLESHPFFKLAVPLFYEFTAYWFGQVEIVTDRFLRPLSDHRQRYFEFVEATLSSLRQGTDRDAGRAWQAFRVGHTALNPGMQILPKSDLSAHYYDGNEFRDTPINEFWEAWPIIEQIVRGDRIPHVERPGLRSRPSGWRSRYATSRPMPFDFDRHVTAAKICKEYDGLSESDVCLYEWAGKLFSVRGESGAEYPWFQALPGIRGEPLEKVLCTLGSPRMSGTSVLNFFTSKNGFLADLSPIEILLADATRSRSGDPEAQRLLNASARVRLIAVLHAAEAYRRTLDE